jgi:hypothetical protein
MNSIMLSASQCLFYLLGCWYRCELYYCGCCGSCFYKKVHIHNTCTEVFSK